ncbi:MAG TPA: MFS transporter, partial [Streptosporangiaceae bacterium]
RLFFQQIGGSIGVSAFGAIFARRLAEALTSVSPGVHLSTSGGQFDPATVRSLPAAIQHDVYYAISYAIHGVFLWAIPASALAFVLAWFIKEVPLRGRTAPGDAETAAPELVG